MLLFLNKNLLRNLAKKTFAEQYLFLNWKKLN